MRKQRTAEAFREPMPVTKIRLFPVDGAYPICPQCGISIEREGQSFCSRCGQCLDWKSYKWAQIIFPKDFPQFRGAKEG